MPLRELDERRRLRLIQCRQPYRLIAASVECVLELRGMTGPATIALRRFAAELGVLFQIVDDILDVTGSEAALGKPQGSDARHGRRTYVSVFGLERARELLSRVRPRAGGASGGAPAAAPAAAPAPATAAPQSFSTGAAAGLE